MTLTTTGAGPSEGQGDPYAGYLVYDTFTDADDTSLPAHTPDKCPVGSVWVEVSGTEWDIKTNAATYDGNASGGQLLCAIDAGAANAYVEVKIVSLGGDGGVVGRLADNSNHILLVLQAGGAWLYKVVAGGYTELGSWAGTVAANDLWRLRCNSANELKAIQNGTDRITATDAAGAANTKWGLRDNSATTTVYDNFNVVAL